MVSRFLKIVAATSVLASPVGLAAETAQPIRQGVTQFVPALGSPDPAGQPADARLAIFTPTDAPVRHTIDYEIWDYALKNLMVAMGPSTRQGAARPDPITGTRAKHGPQSRYRLEGSLVLFNFFDDKVIASFSEYRQDLERVAATLDIAALPRNEQLAFWLNLHNAALLEQIAREWPVREPHEITIGGEPLDEARFITLRGIPVSLRDIRENIVFRHWKDPKVIYGFWRGDIGGPQLQPHAFTGANVASLLDVAAADYVNSLRGTQKNGSTLEVSRLYADVAPFYFPDFERDLRAHLARYAEEPVADLLARTDRTRASIAETEIADLNGGARPPITLFVSSQPGALDDPLVGCPTRVGQAACDLLQARAMKLQRMIRRDQPTTRVFFSNIALPGDPPNKNAVE